MRHGQSTWIAEGRFQGQADPPLSALGEEQAARVAARLGGPRGGDPLPPTAPHALWSSPLGRARATAGHLAALPGWPPIRTADGLREIGQGEWEGQPSKVVAERWPELLAGWRRDPATHHAPGGEAPGRRGRPHPGRPGSGPGGPPGRSTTDARPTRRPRPPRRCPAMRPATTARPWAVVVAHDGVLRLALLALLGLPLGAFWRLPFVLCGITVVTIDGGATALRAHNLAEHLDEPVSQPEVARPGAL